VIFFPVTIRECIEMSMPLMRQSTAQDPIAASMADRRDAARTAGSSRSSSRSRKRRSDATAVIIDKSELGRIGLAHSLAESRFRVTASVSSLSEVSERLVSAKRCVALISLDTAAIMMQFRPLSERGLRLIVLADTFSPQEVIAAIEAGASGYLVKNAITAEALVKSMELALLGVAVIPQEYLKLLKSGMLQSGPIPAVLVQKTVPGDDQPQPASDAAQADELSQISKRERTVLEVLMRGGSNKTIARELDIAEATVKVHVKSLLRKIGVVNRTQAAMWARGRLEAEPRTAKPAVSTVPAIAATEKANGVSLPALRGLRELDFHGRTFS
jgi:two-component system nitrate/nitrite response regulator NarL